MDKAEEKFESQRFFCPADYFACFYCKHEFNGDLREWDPHCENEKFIEKYAGELNEYEKDYGGKKTRIQTWIRRTICRV